MSYPLNMVVFPWKFLKRPRHLWVPSAIDSYSATSVLDKGSVINLTLMAPSGWSGRDFSCARAIRKTQLDLLASKEHAAFRTACELTQTCLSSVLMDHNLEMCFSLNKALCSGLLSSISQTRSLAFEFLFLISVIFCF